MTTENFQLRQLADELHPPESGKRSIVLADDADTKVVLFAFAAGDDADAVELIGDDTTDDEN